MQPRHSKTLRDQLQEIEDWWETANPTEREDFIGDRDRDDLDRTWAWLWSLVESERRGSGSLETCKDPKHEPQGG